MACRYGHPLAGAFGALTRFGAANRGLHNKENRVPRHPIPTHPRRHSSCVSCWCRLWLQHLFTAQEYRCGGCHFHQPHCPTTRSTTARRRTHDKALARWAQGWGTVGPRTKDRQAKATAPLGRVSIDRILFVLPRVDRERKHQREGRDAVPHGESLPTNSRTNFQKATCATTLSFPLPDTSELAPRRNRRNCTYMDVQLGNWALGSTGPTTAST